MKYFVLFIIVFNISSVFSQDSLNTDNIKNKSKMKKPTKVKTKLNKKVLTECPQDMEYVIVNYNTDKVYEICIDKYEYPNQKGKFPKVNVTWYKANKICESQGKYLCWDNEWLAACKGINNWDFSYYNIYDPDKCNVNSGQYSKLGDNPECSPKNYNIYDLVGNVREWTRGGGIGASGGNYYNKRLARCSKWDALSIKKTYKDVGFRCCVKVNTGRYNQIKKVKSKEKKDQKKEIMKNKKSPDKNKSDSTSMNNNLKEINEN